jgi:hypothetical protein
VTLRAYSRIGSIIPRSSGASRLSTLNRRLVSWRLGSTPKQHILQEPMVTITPLVDRKAITENARRYHQKLIDRPPPQDAGS